MHYVFPFLIEFDLEEKKESQRCRHVLVPPVRVVVVVLGGGGRVSRSYFHENSFGRDLYEGVRKVYTKFGIYPV